MNGAGFVEFSGATLDPVLTSCLAAIKQATGSLQYSVPGGGDIYIDGGSHVLSGAFAGWDMPALTKITLAENCFIIVPQGYSGYVFKIPGLASSSSQKERVVIQGGYLKENGTPARLWTAFLLADDTGLGVQFNRIGPDIHILNAGKAIHLRIDSPGSGWINGNIFEFITFNTCVIGVHFDYNGNTPTATNGAHRNMFLSLEGQASTPTTHGYKDIHGKMNYFIDCKIWDLAGAQISANITANAIGTHIYGGIMTSLNFTDSGISTFYDDDVSGYVHKGPATNAAIETIGVARITGLALQTPVISPSTLVGTEPSIVFKQYNNSAFNVNVTPFSDASSTSWSLYNTTGNERMFIQKNAGTSYIFCSQKISSGGNVLPVIFETIDSTGVGTLESFRMQTDASLKFATFHEKAVVTAPADPAANLVRVYPKQVDANNDGYFVKAKVNGAVVEVQMA